MKKLRPPAVCPVCGEDVPPRDLACPECGADHKSGWREEAAYDWLDLPNEEFDYNEFVREEFGEGKGRRPLSPLWWLTALLLLILFGLAYACRG